MTPLLEKYFLIIKKFIPEPVIKPSLGLDIGTSACKFIELIPKDNTFEVQNWAVESIQGGNVGESIKKVLGKFNIQSKSISTSLCGQGTLIRYIEMPRMSLDDLRNSFHIEADRYFPFPQDQIYTDCFILDPKSKGNKMTVLVAVAKKELVEKRIKLLTDLGLQTQFVGINSIALANVFSVLKQKVGQKNELFDEGQDGGAVAVLDFGETTSNLVVLKDGLPRFTRDIFLGGKELNKRISNVLGVSLDEAERIKRQSNVDMETILNACDSILLNLISEVRLSYDYFVTENNMQVSKLYLTGGTSSLPKIAEFFSKNLEMPVDYWDPFKAIKISPNLSSDDFAKSVNQLGVALGLALYQYE